MRHSPWRDYIRCLITSPARGLSMQNSSIFIWPPSLGRVWRSAAACMLQAQPGRKERAGGPLPLNLSQAHTSHLGCGRDHLPAPSVSCVAGGHCAGWHTLLLSLLLALPFSSLDMPSGWLPLSCAFKQLCPAGGHALPPTFHWLSAVSFFLFRRDTPYFCARTRRMRCAAAPPRSHHAASYCAPTTPPRRLPPACQHARTATPAPRAFAPLPRCHRAAPSRCCGLAPCRASAIIAAWLRDNAYRRAAAACAFARLLPPVHMWRRPLLHRRRRHSNAASSGGAAPTLNA